jgi:hypothetical protein
MKHENNIILIDTRKTKIGMIKTQLDFGLDGSFGRSRPLKKVMIISKKLISKLYK